MRHMQFTCYSSWDLFCFTGVVKTFLLVSEDNLGPGGTTHESYILEK